MRKKLHNKNGNHFPLVKYTEHIFKISIKLRCSWLQFNSTPYRLKSTKTYTLSSRQILGPTTLAAPLAILKAKCFSGQAFEIPHLYLGGFVALGGENMTSFFRKQVNRLYLTLLQISNHKGQYAKHQDTRILKYKLIFSPEGFKEPQKIF